MIQCHAHDRVLGKFEVPASHSQGQAMQETGTGLISIS